MSEWIVFLTSSKVELMAIFFLLAVVSVTALEAIRVRVARAQGEDNGTEPVMRIVTAAAVLSLAMLVVGGSGLFLVGRNFLNMTLTMFGVANLLVISAMTWQFRNGQPLTDEDAHIAAQDL
jgi:hypothetical protein